MSIPNQSQKVRQDPRFAINALMKYSVANSLHRRNIIHEQKYPPTFKATWYDRAHQAITKFIVDGMQDESPLKTELSSLLAATPSNDNEALKISLNIEAIESFLDSYDQIPLGNLTPSNGTNFTPHVILSGVSVSVRPDVELRGVIRGKDHAGSLKLYFSKPDRLSKDAFQLGAVLLVHHCRNHVADAAEVKPANCFVFDVFGGQCYTAPSAFTLRFRNLEANCKEIADRWPLI